MRLLERPRSTDHCLQRSHPCGLTLLEILVSTAILVGSLTAIMQVLNVGHNSRLKGGGSSQIILANSSAVIGAELSPREP